jgi:hypothetical protein
MVKPARRLPCHHWLTASATGLGGDAVARREYHNCKSASWSWDPDAFRFLDGLVRAQRFSKDHVHEVLALLSTYARADLIVALWRTAR